MFSDAVHQVWNLTDTLLVRVHNTLVPQLGAFVTTLFALQLVLLGYRAYWGHASPADVLKRTFIAAVFAGLILDARGQALIRQAAQVPHDIGLAVLAALQGYSTPEAATQSLDTLMSNLLSGVDLLVAASSWKNPLPLLGAIVLLLAIVVFFAYCAYLIVLSVILTTVFLALFPPILALSLFEPLRPLLQGLIRQTATYALVPLLVYTTLGFIGTLLTRWSRRATGSGWADLADAIPILFLLIVTFLLLTQIVGAAAGLVGGIGMRPVSLRGGAG